MQFYSVLLVVEMGEKMNVPVKNPPLQLNWQCLADTQPHHSKTLLEINRGEMY